MSLLYKEDWAEARERYRAWWAGEAIGRCGMWVTAPRAGVARQPKPVAPADPETKWTDLDYWVRFNEWRFSQTFHGGEAFPTWDCGYPGRECIATFVGCPIKLGPDTGWIDPIFTDEDFDVRGLRVDFEDRWWKLTLQMLETGAERFGEAAVPSVGAFGGSGDTLAALRGSDRLLLDLVDRPERVLEAELFLMEMWCEVYDRFFAAAGRAGAAAGGSTSWFPLWAPGKFYATQCDFAFMISPEMFRRMFLPAIERQVRFLDHCIHHVDGIGNFAHVDALLELPGLRAFEILPGAGKPSPLHYMETLRKVQAAGRNLHITIPAAEVRAALEALSARGLFIETTCETEAEARDLLRKAEKWSRDR